jgi:hypothetical protein
LRQFQINSHVSAILRIPSPEFNMRFALLAFAA